MPANVATLKSHERLDGPDDRKNSLMIALFQVSLMFVASSSSWSSLGDAFRINLGIIPDVLFAFAIVVGALLVSGELKNMSLSVTAALVAFLLFICMVSCLMVSGKYLAFVKFFMAIILAWIASAVIGARFLKSFITRFVKFGTLYSLIVLLFLSDIHHAIAINTISYLPITYLPALTLTFAIVVLVFERKFQSILYSIIIFILCATIFSFEGRGNVIFPLLAVIVVAAIANVRNPLTFIKYLVGVVFLVTAVVTVYVCVVPPDSDLAMRISRLFFDTESEPRILLYQAYVNYLSHDYNWVFGIGFNNGSVVPTPRGELYPHNFLLQLFSDLGLIGLIVGLLLTAIYARCFFLLVRNAGVVGEVLSIDKWVVMALNAATLFVVMSYFKSYSVYAGFSLIILLGLTFGLNARVNHSGHIGNGLTSGRMMSCNPK